MIHLRGTVKTFKELLDRLHAVQGVPFAELAVAHGIQWHHEPAKNKGLGGKVVEAALGKMPDSAPLPDLSDLSMEIKTVSIKEGLQPREHVKITSLNHLDVIDQDWERSTVFHKLRSVLFVPIVKYELATPDQWYIRSPFVWMPSLDAAQALRADYEAVRERLTAGGPESLTSAKPPKGFCAHLIPNTAGQNKEDKVTYEHAGKTHHVRRRAWMLRKDFVADVLRENVSYEP